MGRANGSALQSETAPKRCPHSSAPSARTRATPRRPPTRKASPPAMARRAPEKPATGPASAPARPNRQGGAPTRRRISIAPAPSCRRALNSGGPAGGWQVSPQFRTHLSHAQRRVHPPQKAGGGWAVADPDWRVAGTRAAHRRHAACPRRNQRRDCRGCFPAWLLCHHRSDHPRANPCKTAPTRRGMNHRPVPLSLPDGQACRVEGRH